MRWPWSKPKPVSADVACLTEMLDHAKKGIIHNVMVIATNQDMQSFITGPGKDSQCKIFAAYLRSDASIRPPLKVIGDRSHNKHP